jgi:hypothetical protein
MFGGVIIGFLCDLPWLTRPKRAIVGWAFVFVTGNVIMGGGLAFENWFEAQGKTHFIVRTCLLHSFGQHLQKLGQRLRLSSVVAGVCRSVPGAVPGAGLMDGRTSPTRSSSSALASSTSSTECSECLWRCGSGPLTTSGSRSPPQRRLLAGVHVLDPRRALQHPQGSGPICRGVQDDAVRWRCRGIPSYRQPPQCEEAVRGPPSLPVDTYDLQQQRLIVRSLKHLPDSSPTGVSSPSASSSPCRLSSRSPSPRSKRPGATTSPRRRTSPAQGASSRRHRGTASSCMRRRSGRSRGVYEYSLWRARHRGPRRSHRSQSPSHLTCPGL